MSLWAWAAPLASLVVGLAVGYVFGRLRQWWGPEPIFIIDTRGDDSEGVVVSGVAMSRDRYERVAQHIEDARRG